MTLEDLKIRNYGKIISLLIDVGLLTDVQVEYALRVKSKIKTEKPNPLTFESYDKARQPGNDLTAD